MSQEKVEVMRGVRYRVSVPSGRAGQRRRLDERLYVRFPALYPLLADRVTRLPPEARLRRSALTYIAGRAVAAANRRDFDVLMIGFDPAIELEMAGSAVGGFMPPDLLGVHRGRDGYVRMWARLIEAWPDLKLEMEELTDYGDRLLTAGRIAGSGRHSGIALDQPLFQLLTLRRGLVIRQKDFADRDQALEAAGLSE
jgi:ketosteroid isomerase-like protein